ncbi:molybdate transport system permease protein [Meinhardsimonia xiamenensis]|uniref:Molybdenum transport system permease n=1 Tax=Meinhardsimonia xiamenensis TaxID=990712 RepID=A0A1G9H2S8_9RHOB|nr:molybdate ABC transporter permease subunit [Meinhardsimonia xiamenensis]PRX29767.1 molybdate transport system permease protein [Meinhardsimonia xiamenensis]SDL07237.1 molybdate transport system permease protein [Meinhardsimonia xiamenensis]
MTGFLTPVLITLKLAAMTTVLLVIFSLPLAWWLATTRTRLRPLVEAVVALPLVLPPTVLGFYLLIFLSPESPLGAAWVRLTGETLTFSFSGLVVGSFLYSLPFAVQPLQTAFQSVGTGYMEAAATLGATRLDAFRSVALPLARRGVLTAAVLSFAHTLGEFGVVLMVGGNIPGKTRVLSIEVFSAVETLDYATAHLLSAGLLVFSFLVLSAVYILNRRDGAGR